MNTNTDTMTTESAREAHDDTAEPCPATGANLIALLTAEDRERLEARFWTKTETDLVTGCLVWTGAVSHNGYGIFGVGNTVARAHRVARVLACGPIPAGQMVRHQCHHPLCVNPAHLTLGTHAENMQDMVDAGRSRSGPGVNPQKLTAEDAFSVLGYQMLGRTVMDTASDFGVTLGTIGAIRGGRSRVAAMQAHLDAVLPPLAA